MGARGQTTAALAFAALTIASSTRARADDAQNEAAARTLFQEGRALMNSGKVAEGCAKLEESGRLVDGIGTKFNLAECWEKLGHFASAWSTFQSVASAARVHGEADRATVAQARADALEPRLSRLVVAVPTARPGLEVKRDGARVGPAQWGVAVPVDPGDHTIESAAPRYMSARAVVRVSGEGTTTTFTVPALVPAETAAETTSESKTPTYVAAGLLATSVVAVALGTFWGLRTKSRADESDTHCNARDQCDPRGLSLRDDAFADGARSTVSFTIAAGTLAGAVLVWVLAPGKR